MNYIPHVLLTDVVKRLALNGFRHLAPLIAAGPDGKSLALDSSVLASVDIDEFIFVSQLCIPGSIYRPFLLKCLSAGNATAQYVEGLRLAAQTGPSQIAIDLLAQAAPQLIYARFALATFLICCGSYDDGMEVFSGFFRSIPTIEEAVGIAEMVVTAIADMGTTPNGFYDESLRFGDLPHCFLNNYSVVHLCPKCFAFKYARRIQQMC